MKQLIRWVKEKDIQCPIKVEFQVDRLSPNGNSCYVLAKIDGVNVSQMIADALHLRTSKQNAVYGDILASGIGNEMALGLQNALYLKAKDLNEKNMFDPSGYVLISNTKEKNVKKLKNFVSQINKGGDNRQICEKSTVSSQEK